MDKVLITGITGMVGSHLADFILELRPKVEIYGLIRRRSPMDNVRHLEEKVTFVEADLCDYSSVFRAIEEVQPHGIFHLAAQSFVPSSYNVPAQTLTTNVIGTCNLLDAVHECGFSPRIHICSSPEVYGNTPGIWNETTVLRPCSPYAASKVGEEMIAISYFKAYRQHIVISRGFAHEGPRRGKEFAVSTIAYQIARIEKGLQEPVIKIGNIHTTRTYCDVRDMARAYWILLEKGISGEVYNIAGDEEWSLEEVAGDLIEKSSNSPVIQSDQSRLRPVDVTRQLANDSKFRILTGWKPEIPFERTLSDMLVYWRQKA